MQIIPLKEGLELTVERAYFSVDTIGIDIDNIENYPYIMQRASMHGDIIYNKESTNGGRHLRIRLTNEIPFLKSLVLRFDIGDDPNRILFDLQRYLKGASKNTIDILFNYKGKIC